MVCTGKGSQEEQCSCCMRTGWRPIRSGQRSTATHSDQTTGRPATPSRIAACGALPRVAPACILNPHLKTCEISSDSSRSHAAATEYTSQRPEGLRADLRATTGTGGRARPGFIVGSGAHQPRASLAHCISASASACVMPWVALGTTSPCAWTAR